MACISDPPALSYCARSPAAHASGDPRAATVVIGIVPGVLVLVLLVWSDDDVHLAFVGDVHELETGRLTSQTTRPENPSSAIILDFSSSTIPWSY